jgi:transposase
MVGRPYSEEYRKRVLDEVAEGVSRRGAARRFKVGASSAIRWKKRLEETGSAAPPPRGGKSRSPLEAHAAWLLALIEAQPDLSLEELTQRVRTELDQKTSSSAIDRFIQRHGLSFKKKRCTPPNSCALTSPRRARRGKRTRPTWTPTG